MNIKAILLLFTIFFISCKGNQDSTIKEKQIESTETQIIVPTEEENGEIINIKNGCSYNYTFSKSKIVLQLPTERGLNQIQNILSFSGLPINFEIYSANIENAAATIIDNKRYIIYDPNLLNYADLASDSYWASMSILAHEIGHHLSGHTLIDIRDGKSKELEADKFSGFVLFKMGATLNQAQVAILKLGSEYDSDTHPSKYKRLEMIQQGWEESSQQRYESAIPPPPSDEDNFSGKYGYIKDEFFKEELIGEAELEDINFGKVIDKYDYPVREGIIIDVEKTGINGDLRADLFDRDPSEYNLVLTIQHTKDSEDPYGNVTKKGKRFEYNLMDYFHTSKADISWLEALLVPGRKIAFKSFYFGYERQDIFYIKKLNR